MFENIKIIGGPLALSSVEDVNAAQSTLGIVFPSGYREYVTQFGEGVLGGSYIRIYPPSRIVDDLGEWRNRIEEYWFWDVGEGVLSKERALEAIVVGDTLAGDELVVHPDNPERILILPRSSEDVFVAGDGLPDAIEWLCTSGTIVEPFSQRDFEPFAKG